jgi:hypothetical protein
MSSQIILPLDVTVRRIFAFDHESDLPVRYKVKKNKITAKYDMIRKNSPYRELVSSDILEAKKLLDGNKVLIGKSRFNANHQAWCMIKNLISKGHLLNDKYLDTNLSKDFVEAETVTVERMGNWLSLSDKQKIRDTISAVSPLFIQLESFALHMERIRDSYNRNISVSLRNWKRDGKPDEFKVSDTYNRNSGLKFYQIGGVVYVKVIDKRENEVTYLLTNIHYKRIIEFIRNLSTLALALPHIYGVIANENTLIKIATKIVDIGLKTPNGVGSVFKCARQILFTSGDTSYVMGRSAARLYMSGLTGDKEKYGEEVADFLESVTNDRKSAINLANIFKMVLHPDADMPKVFDSIMGSKDPNKPILQNMPRFEGMVRKSCFESLTQQRKQVRAEPKDPTDSIASNFASSINATSIPVANLLKAGYGKWSNIKFKVVRGLFDADKQDIPVQNKASAPNLTMNLDQIRKVADSETKSIDEYKNVVDRLKAVNDVVVTLSGESELDFIKARMRFRNVMRLHKQFEAKHLRNGQTIEDISSKDLTDFIESSYEARYTVATEPKLGEVHKEITRMFYMAEQALKIMTQVCERFVKKVISKSSGISITKSHRMRRKEIEAMLCSYTGFTHIEDAGDDLKVIYISFDMSEFSKKFPNALVRIIGSVLTELSGEDWMSRIDLFFRASIVYHSTRGFTDYTSGMKGGFEGFLNFLWTLAMKVVMDIAAQSTGVMGVLAVYSDDGLLRLYVNGTMNEVREKVNKIQKVFKDYGLIFHMDKTVASTEIMEYLGVYGEKGMIIPTWIKELTSIGKRKSDPGIETVSDKVILWSSQCSAMITAKGPPELAMLIQNIMTIGTLRRLNSRVSSKTLAVLTTIPYSAGGFRTPSITESGLLSKINPVSEFTADVELLYDSYPSQINGVFSRINENLVKPKTAERTLLTGSLLQTELKDTSGLGVVRNLLEKSTIDSKLVRDPMTKEKRDKILISLKTSENIDIKVVQKLIQAIPEVINYNKTTAIMKSSAALRFVSQKDIAKSQMTDTRRCRKSIEEWDDYFTHKPGIGQRIKSSDLTYHIIKKLYPDYAMSRFCDSPRTAIHQNEDTIHVHTSFEPFNRARITEQEYKEPIAQFLGAQLTPEITAESTGNTKQREMERFISVAARLVSTNSSLLYVYNIVANAFRLPCPSLPASYVVSSHRSTKNFGENAVAAHLPIPYHALILSKMSNLMYSTLATQDRIDRTTYVESCRIPSYLKYKYRDIDKYKISGGSSSTNYSIRDIADNCANPTFDGICPPDHDLVTNETTGVFMDLLVEENAQARSAADTTFTANVTDALRDNATTKAILLTRLEKWLYASINGSIVGEATHCPTEIPIAWKVEVMVESVCNVSLRMLRPFARTTIQRNLSEFISRSSGMSTEESFNNPELRNMFTFGIQKSGDRWDELGDQIRKVGLTLSMTDMDDRHKEIIGSLNTDELIVKIGIVNTLKRLSVTGGKKVPTVVINTDSFADTRMSRVVKNSIRDAVNSLYQGLIDKLSKTNFEGDPQILDCNANLLLIIKNMLRPSGHRNTPFNKHMVMIQLIKFELFLSDKISEGDNEVDMQELIDFRIPTDACIRICDMNSAIGGRIPNTTGEDMRHCLFNEGLPTWAYSRIKYILRKLGDEYLGSSITLENIVTDNLFMHKLMNYVTNTYNNSVKESVSNLDIRHNRESQVVSKLTTVSPVEESSMIYATINDDLLMIDEVDLINRLDSEDYKSLLKNLLSAHYTRWGVNGYDVRGGLNPIVNSTGLKGDSELVLRDFNDNPISSKITTADFTISLSKYMFEDSAAHNYLFINRLPSGMAVMAKDKDDFLVLGIIPKGTEIINTPCAHFPEYAEGFDQSPIIYEIKRAAVNIGEAARALNATGMRHGTSGEMASIVISQAYQRLIGARATVVNDDDILVALGELVRGAWCNDTGYRAAALLGAWFDSNGSPDRRGLTKSSRELLGYASSPDNITRAELHGSIAAIWQWINLMNIHQGPDINSIRVTKILKLVGKGMSSGGSPTEIINMSPRSIREVKALVAATSLKDILLNARGILFNAPPPIVDDRSLSNFDELDFGDGDF